jgi:hypothetical protein
MELSRYKKTMAMAKRVGIDIVCVGPPADPTSATAAIVKQSQEERAEF